MQLRGYSNEQMFFTAITLAFRTSPSDSFFYSTGNLKKTLFTQSSSSYTQQVFLWTTSQVLLSNITELIFKFKDPQDFNVAVSGSGSSCFVFFFLNKKQVNSLFIIIAYYLFADNSRSIESQ